MIGFLKRFIDSIIGKDEAKFRMQNAAFDLSLQMHTRMIDGLIKRLLKYRFMNSQEIIDKAVVEEFRQSFLPEKQKLNEDDISKMVEGMYKSIPDMQRLQLPEATIATISETYHNILRNRQLTDKVDIYIELDRTRNANYLQSFGEQELTLINYIIHVMKIEDETGVMNRLNIDFLKKQIQIADEYGTNHKARAKDAMEFEY